jgi:TonB family protein
MLELKPRPTVRTSQARAFESPQPRRLLLALILLLFTLAGVIVKDREFWFGSEQLTLDADGAQPAVAPQTAAKSVPAATTQTQSASALATKKKIPAAKTATATTPADAPAVATTRTILPPLDVEVVAGDTHSKIHPGSNAARVEITHPGSPAPAQSTPTFAAATNAAEREPMSTQPQASSYPLPLLAQHMNVQGSVVLQAVIGSDGIIQDLHVLSGPAILSSAAQQAVREWRFKPIVQNGQAVESKARITVNFTIKVADGSAKTTLAETRSEDIQILSR